ncbi:entericidin A/B family lipoprotein [Segnochrobactrum spirostomi]|uniref:Entericidin A/B family lipoprotein n=1 Tax=Segnochrobactrum spirostomi TaxID=2608987 RepID=A0A6A7Y0Q7_9HYPH|nr:entericidin A/B family lipoprotein [Segnochrobactrum spirostomi]MQT11977.1 entericidin A/B family lipoprotein [Segnochrobactrum spirostomi]
MTSLRTLVVFASLAVSALALAACGNTVRGVGQDMSKNGSAVQGAAEDMTR